MRERLKTTFSEAGVRRIYCDIKERVNLLSFAKEYVFDEDYKVARSALWTLTKADSEELSHIKTLLNPLTDLAMIAENASVRRLSLNIIERIDMNQNDVRTDFLDYCYEHMVQFDEYPAIQAACMRLVFRISLLFPELLGELKRTLEAMETDYYKPAVVNVRNRILRGKLEKEIKKKQ